MEDYDSEQWEALKRWLKENGAWIVGGVVIGAGLLFGYSWWNARVTARGEAASTHYVEMLEALNRSDRTRAIELSDQLQAEYSDTPYADQAALALARVDVDRNELEEAARRLRGVMDNSDDQELRTIARLRLARVQLAQGKSDEALTTLGDKAPAAFAPRFTEVRGDILLAKGDKAGALAAYREALAATEPGVVDQSLLQLKISDLASPADSGAQTPIVDKEPAR